MTTMTLGGSEAAAACGLDRYKSKIQLWLEKTGKLERESAGSDAAKWGNLLEPVIAGQLVTEGFDIRYLGTTELVTDGFRSCHPDGMVGDNGVLEIKTIGARGALSWSPDDLPVGFVIQAVHNMALTGKDFCLVACLIAGQRLEVSTIERDHDLEARVMQLEDEFWLHVTEGTPPEPDGSKATDEMLKKMYPGAYGVVNLTSEDLDLVKELKMLKDASAAAEKQIAEREQRLKMLLGDATLGLFEGDAVVRWPVVEAKKLDTKRIKEEYPEIAAECTRTSSYRRFVVTP